MPFFGGQCTKHLTMYLGFADLVQLRKVFWFNSLSDSYFINIDIAIVRDKLDYIWSQNIIAAIMVIIMTMALCLHNVKELNFVLFLPKHRRNKQ